MITAPRSFVEQMAETIMAEGPSNALSCALDIVAEVAKRQRLAAVVDYARGREPRAQSRAEQVVAEVARRFGETPEDVVGRSADRRLTVPRAVLWDVLHVELEMSAAAIGRFCSRRDHSTILRGLNIAETRDEVRQHVAEVSARLRARWGTDSAEAAE